MSFLSFFTSKRTPIENPLKWDMHNHLLPGIDDGSPDVSNSELMFDKFMHLGYQQITATPHIMRDFYPNTPETISEAKNLLNSSEKVREKGIEINAAAEYYMDEYLLEMVKNKENLLTVRDNMVLVETSFMNKPVFFEQLLFDMKTAGYQPILAHPERYIYLQENYELAEQIMQSGVKLQINLMSLIGYYSPNAKKLAQWLIKNNYYHFLGTDAHNLKHLDKISEVFASKLFSEIDFSRVENA